MICRSFRRPALSLDYRRCISSTCLRDAHQCILYSSNILLTMYAMVRKFEKVSDGVDFCALATLPIGETMIMIETLYAE